MKITRSTAGEPVSKRRALIGVDLTESPHFRSVWTTFREEGEDGVIIEPGAAELLGLADGSEAWVLPLEGSPDPGRSNAS
jgi:hypothetical protein